MLIKIKLKFTETSNSDVRFAPFCLKACFFFCLQISNISARIAALKSAGLNVDPQSRFNKTPKTTTDTVLDTDSEQDIEFCINIIKIWNFISYRLQPWTPQGI